MNMTPDKYVDRLIEILQKKKVFLQGMLVLTEAQSGTISEDGLDRLQKLIEEKQLKIDAIDKLDGEFNVFFQRLKTSIKIKSLEELDITGIPAAKQLKSITGEVMEIISQIGELERQNSEKSKKLLNFLGSEIKKINQGKKVNNAYAPPPTGIPSYFIDKKK